MSKENELSEAVKETLRRDGFLNKLQAEMRVRVMGLLGEGLHGARGIPEKPRLPQEILFLNELIREYLEWMAYTYSNSVFISESGMPPRAMSRARLGSLLGVLEDERSKALPLLFNLVTDYKERAPTG